MPLSELQQVTTTRTLLDICNFPTKLPNKLEQILLHGFTLSLFKYSLSSPSRAVMLQVCSTLNCYIEG